jgi:N-acetylmuramoyl-L-alanine amidase
MRLLLIALTILLLSALFALPGWSFGAESLSKKLGLRIKTIYLDPWYGGKEKGPRLSKVKWGKDFTLEIAQEMKKLLKTRGFTVHLSRSDDSFVPPESRAFQAHAKHSDLYIAIKVAESKKDCISIFTDPKPIKKHNVVSEKTDDPSKELNEILATLSADDKHEESVSIAGTISKKLSESDLFDCIQLLRSFDYALLNTSMPAVTLDFSVSSAATRQPYIIDAAFEKSVAQLLSDAIKEYVDDRAPKMNP